MLPKYSRVCEFSIFLSDLWPNFANCLWVILWMITSVAKSQNLKKKKSSISLVLGKGVPILFRYWYSRLHPLMSTFYFGWTLNPKLYCTRPSSCGSWNAEDRWRSSLCFRLCYNIHATTDQNNFSTLITSQCNLVAFR